jgi:5-methylcytosine-specific restriction enzyme subunit McrC
LLCNEYRGKEWPKFHYHRLNAHYERVHKIGHYLWQGLSAKTFFNRQNFYYSFLINMNELFEKFVVTLLRKHLPKEYNVKAGKRITDAITLDGQSYRHIIPDIVVENKRTKETKVLDVKYKQYGKRRVDTSDVFQLAFYAQNQKRGHEGGYESSIIYPGFLGDDWKKERSIELNVCSGYPGVLNLKPISIEWVLEAAMHGENTRLMELAKEVLE